MKILDYFLTTIAVFLPIWIGALAIILYKISRVIGGKLKRFFEGEHPLDNDII